MNRDYNISLIRLLAMMSIVMCHVCQALEMPIANWLNIGVEVFLLISGWLFSRRRKIEEVSKWLLKRFIRIYIPYIIVVMSLIVSNSVIGVRDDLPAMLRAIFCISSGSLINGSHLWYISVTFFCYLSTPLLIRFWQKRTPSPQFFLTLFLCVGFSYLCFHNGKWIVAYFIGFILGRCESTSSNGRRILHLTCACALSSSIVFTSMYYLLSTGKAPLYYLSHISIALFFFTLVLSMDFYNMMARYINLDSILKMSDKYSYDVYLVHQFPILGSFTVFRGTIPLYCSFLAIIVWIASAGPLLNALSSWIISHIQKQHDQRYLRDIDA